MDPRILTEVVANIPEDIRSKFRTHAIDLTGIFSELDKLLDSLVKSKASHVEFCDRALEALETLEKATIPYPKHSASFVVSSLVSSQLSHKINEYLDARSQESYGKPFTTKSLTLITKSLSRLEEAHMQDLLTLVASTGKIYFADHFSLQNAMSVVMPDGAVIHTTKETCHLLCGVKIQEFVRKHFKTLRKEEWEWIFPVHDTKDIRVQLANGKIILASKACYKIFNITSLTLSP